MAFCTTHTETHTPSIWWIMIADNGGIIQLIVGLYIDSISHKNKSFYLSFYVLQFAMSLLASSA